MVLAAVEESLYSSKVEALQVPTRLSIEHILPQKWQTHWPLAPAPGEDPADAEAHREAHVHLLGNLTLTTLPLNVALSNAAWPAKQKELNSGSKLLLNPRLIDEFGAQFDEAAIEARGADLTRKIISIWPGPSSSAWGVTPIATEPEPSSDAPPDTSAQPSQSSSAPIPAPHDLDEGDGLLEAVRDQLAQGQTPDQIYPALGRSRRVWLLAITEEARQSGVLGTGAATPENVAALRERENLRWERIAARVLGDPARTELVKLLYDEARGTGAAKRSYTGRGRRFPGMA